MRQMHISPHVIQLSINCKAAESEWKKKKRKIKIPKDVESFFARQWRAAIGGLVVRVCAMLMINDNDDAAVE